MTTASATAIPLPRRGTAYTPEIVAQLRASLDVKAITDTLQADGAFGGRNPEQPSVSAVEPEAAVIAAQE